MRNAARARARAVAVWAWQEQQYQVADSPDRDTGYRPHARPTPSWEGPLVSDTTELFGSSGAPRNPGPRPVSPRQRGCSAAAGTGAACHCRGGTGQRPGDSAPAGETVTDKPARRGGSGLSGMLLADLQRIAQRWVSPAPADAQEPAHRSYSGQEAGGSAYRRRRGGPAGPQDGTAAPAGSRAHDNSVQRGAPAKAGAPRHREQDAMESDTPTQPALGNTGQSGPAQEAAATARQPRAATRRPARPSIGPAPGWPGPGRGMASLPSGRPVAVAPAAGHGRAERRAEAPADGQPAGRAAPRAAAPQRPAGRRDRRRRRPARQPEDGGQRDEPARPRTATITSATVASATASATTASAAPAWTAGRRRGPGRRRNRDRFRNRNRRRERGGGRRGRAGHHRGRRADPDRRHPGRARQLRVHPHLRLPARAPTTCTSRCPRSASTACARATSSTGAVRQPRDGERREKFNALVRLDTINGLDPEQSRGRPEFAKLAPLYPQERLRLETEPHVLTTRIIDLVMPDRQGPARRSSSPRPRRARR